MYKEDIPSIPVFPYFLIKGYSKKDKVVVEKSIHSHFPDQTKNNREENN